MIQKSKAPIGFGRAFAGIGVTASLFGVVLVGLQHWRLATYRALPVIVESTTIRGSNGGSSKGASYFPVVRYSYEVNGQRYTSESVTPVTLGSGRGRAARLVAGFQPGGEYTAYVSPSNSSNSFLVHQVDFGPYFILLFPMLFVAIGLGVLMETRWETDPAGASRILVIVWYAVGMVAVADYVFAAIRPYPIGDLLSFGVYFALGLVFIAAQFILKNRRPVEVAVRY